VFLVVAPKRLQSDFPVRVRRRDSTDEIDALRVVRLL